MSFLKPKFLPYSTNFINQLSEINEVEDEDEKSEVKDVPKVVTVPSTGRILQIPIKQNAFILCSEEKSTLYASGFCFVTLIKGKVSADGFSLELGSKIKLLSTSWQPAMRLFCCGSSSKKNKNIAKLLKDLNILLPSVELDRYKFIILVEGLLDDEQDWLIAAEDKRMFMNEKKKSLVIPSTKKVSELPIQSVLSVSTAVIGQYESFHERKIDMMQLPSSWVSGIEQLLYGVNSNGINNYKQQQSSIPVKAMICGAKGVGKSSYLRYMINNLLSQKEITSVCVLDCDVGQNEFIVPGVVSLTIVSSPILSPAHLHMQEPDTQYYFGNITPKQNPDLIIEYVRRLYQRYSELYAQETERKFQETKNHIIKSQSSNSFAMLLADLDDDNSNSKNNSYNTSSNSKLTMNTILPLIINTDGYIRYMGAEILNAIVDIIQPSHIFHISTNKDRSLPALDKIRSSWSNNSNSSNNNNNNSINNSNSSNSGNISGNVNDNSASNIFANTQIITLDPGRIIDAKVAAIDLRGLKLISYFLGDRNEQLKPKIAINFDDDTPSEQNTSLVSNNKNPVLDLGLIKKTTGITIRNGIVNDPSGALLLELLSLSPYIVPFHSISLHMMSPGLAHEMLLAAFNASIVGIVSLNSSNSNSNSVNNNCNNTILRKSFIMRNNNNNNNSNSDNSATTRFQLNILDNTAISPCIGIGIVRAIDITRNAIILTTRSSQQLPVLQPQLQSQSQPQLQQQTLALYRGDGSLILPNILLYSSIQPAFPYLSSESYGEGTEKMKGRINQKRKSQHLN